MSRDFKSYMNNNPNLKSETSKEQAAKEQAAKNKDSSNDKEKIAETVEDIAKQYEGKSEEELMSDILKRASIGKQDGSIDFNELDKMTQKIVPMLNSEQQEKLDYIMNLIKKK